MNKQLKAVLGFCIAVLGVLACVFGVVSFGSRLLIHSGWEESESGAVRYLDEYGDPLLGWQEIGEETYYFDPSRDGTMATGWLDTAEGRYYLDAEGRRATGWLAIDGFRYYLDGSGLMTTGWLEMADGQRYFDEQGVMVSGWMDLDGKRYYFNENGALLSGWLELEDGRYYLNADGSVYSGWLETEAGRYYLGEDGSLTTGWLEQDEGTYYLASDGRMARGWLDLESGRYFLDDHGLMQTGWLYDENERYYLGGDGVMVTGWLSDGEDRYYFREDGTMAVGQVVIDGTSSFFTSQGKHVVLVNAWNPVPADYETELVEYQGYQIDAGCVEALDRLLAACTDAGFTYYLNSIYRSEADQQQIWDERYAGYIDAGYTEEEALQFVSQSVAVPGTSEHHLGLAADIGGEEEMYAWMRENSWKYGFIVRYPEDKTDYTGIIYEPWHVRYVGVELARELYELDLCMEEYMEMLTQG